MTCRIALMALLVFAGLLLPVGGANAVETSLLATANAIRASTPQCRDYPNAPVRGFVVGQAGYWPTRTFSFVGCFQSVDACERWRRPVSSFIEQRMIQNRCVILR